LRSPSRNLRKINDFRFSHPWRLWHDGCPIVLRASDWRAGLAKIQEEICMSLRKAGWLLSAAAAFFWLSWALMPGVGVTAAAQIFDLVSK